MIKLKTLLFESPQKLIVYHGTDKQFRKFSLKKAAQNIIWFTSNKKSIIDKTVGASGYGYIITAEVTINNPAGWNEYNKYLLDQLIHLGYDGAILPNDEGFDCFVFNPSQIKILKTEPLV